MESSRTKTIAFVLLVVTLLTAGCAVFGVTAGFRLPATLAFLLAPGWVVARYLWSDRPAMEWTLSVAIGCALGILVAQVMVSTGAWHPVGALLILCAATSAGLVHHLARRARVSQ
jgi:peptidoglycan/LPS O-acetylase OafA/YrhL